MSRLVESLLKRFRSVEHPKVFEFGELSSSGRISKTIFQCDRRQPPSYVLEMFNERLPAEWRYKHFTDSEIIEFFKNHPHAAFPKITKQFRLLKCGAHKADLFRYYYLFLNGGLFVDSDAMVCGNVASLLEECSFLSVNSAAYPGAIFQGILAACPRNPIILSALQDAYQTDNRILRQDYHHLCRQLYEFYHSSTAKSAGILLREERDTNSGYDRILDAKGEVLFKHFWREKVVPRELER